MNIKSKKRLLIIKRPLKTIVILAFFCAYILSFPSSQPIFKVRGLNITDETKVLLYTKEKKENSVFTGDYYELHTTVKKLRSTKEAHFYSYATVEVYTDKDKVFETLNFQIKKQQHINGGIVYTGYSSSVKSKVLKKHGVNIQIFVKDERVLIGTPTIYGSY